MADELDSKKKLDLEHLKYLYALEFEMIRATAAFEHAALRPPFILNGGALITYLALYGALKAALDISIGRFALFAWVVGLLLATVAAFFGALSQFAYRKHRGQEVGREEIRLGMRDGSIEDVVRTSGIYAGHGECRRRIAVTAGIISVVLFIAGFWPAFSSIR